jgi:multicomponent Na+:H+ antiporter subunit A
MFGFIGALLGLMLADGVLLLMACWMLAALFSYLMVGYQYADSRVRYSAQQALLATAGSGFVLLTGLLMLSVVAQSSGVPASDAYSFSALLIAHDGFPSSTLLDLSIILIIVGCLILSVQIPLHFWLTNAIYNPAPISTYLHIGGLVLAGVAVLVRLCPLFIDSLLWSYTLVLVGVSSFCYGAAMALRQYDLKLWLTYATISKLGLLVLLAGIGSDDAAGAIMVGLLAFISAIGALFLLIGTMSRETGTYDLRHLGQMHIAMPVTAWLMLLSACSLAGMPLFGGFLATELLFEAVVSSSLPQIVRIFVTFLLALGLALSIVYVWRLVRHVVLAERSSTLRRKPRESPAHVLFGSGALTSFSVALGVPGAVWTLAVRNLVEPAAGVVAQVPVIVAIEPGWPLVFSLLTFIPGIMLIRYEQRLIIALRVLPTGQHINLLYDAVLVWVERRAANLAHLLQRSGTRDYLRLMVLAWLVVIAGIVVNEGSIWPTLPEGITLSGFSVLPAVLLGALVVVSTVVLLLASSTIRTLLGLGGTVLGVVVVLLLAGAADLALTLLMVAMLSGGVLALLLVSPVFRGAALSREGGRVFDIFMAVSVGLAMTMLTLLSGLQNPVSRPLASYLESAPIPGESSNILQVVLTDIRSFDTISMLGVLFAALLSIYSVFRLRRRPRTTQPAETEPLPQEGRRYQ